MTNARTTANSKGSRIGGPARPRRRVPEAVSVVIEPPPPRNGTAYSVGNFVVHPKYGVGQVEGVQNQITGAGLSPCLEIVFPQQEMKLSIPVDQVERSGMRRPIARRDLDQVFKVLRGRATVSAEPRSAKRVLDYRRRLSLGDPTSLAEAIRDLGRLSRRKPLSYEERRILGTALRILSREVALARGREPDQVREEIERIVYR